MAKKSKDFGKLVSTKVRFLLPPFDEYDPDMTAAYASIAKRLYVKNGKRTITEQKTKLHWGDIGKTGPEQVIYTE